MNLIRSLFENRIHSLTITLDRTNQSYFPGEIITGRLSFSLSESIDPNNLKLSFIGQVNTLIGTSKSSNHRRHHHIEDNGVGIYTTTANNIIIKRSDNNHGFRHESYELFHLNHLFAPNGNGTKLGAGNHELPFQFAIPANIPSSFRYKNCAYVEYNIKASVGGKSKEVNIEIKGFPSVSPNELNAPVHDQQSKTVGLISGKPLSMRCSISKAGWTLGSNIVVDCFIDNHSDRSMTLSGSIIQNIRVIANNHNEDYDEKILTTFGQLVPANKLNGHYQVPILLPKDLPIIQNTCRTIQVSYYVEIKLDIPLAINLYCKLPIILTYQPLNPPQQQLQPMSNFYQPQPITNQPPVNPDYVYPQIDSSNIPSAPPIGFAEAPPPYSEEFMNNNSQSMYPTLPTKN